METIKESHNQKKLLHIAMFPWLAYGHLMPFLQLSKFLAQKGHRISFISTPKNLHRLPTSSSLSPLIKLIELPMPVVDGLPESAESTSDVPINKVPYLKKAYDKLELPLTHCLEDLEVNWIVIDFASHWLPRVATRLGINSVYFTIFNATSMAFLGPPSEILGGERQQPEDFTVVPKWIDFPNYDVKYKLHEVITHWECMEEEVSDFQRVAAGIQGCDFVATRTCPEFDADSLSLLNKLYGKPVVPLGLLPPVLTDADGAEESEGDKWRSLREWLDNKKEKSVVYIALGTEVTLSREAMHELARGIEKSGLRFIWVLGNRQLAEAPDMIPVGFETRVGDRGLVWRGWAPQLRVLAHSSIGGFLTHCGWSSVIEALGFGRALILFSGASSDQGLIARLMHGKRVGLEIPRDDRDGSFSSDAVAKSIRQVMVEKEGETLRKNAWAMREIFGNLNLNNKYLDEFAKVLETWPTSTS
ncbi:UDP-glycosyltransferase 91C1-like [Rosa sericea]